MSSRILTRHFVIAARLASVKTGQLATRKQCGLVAAFARPLLIVETNPWILDPQYRKRSEDIGILIRDYMGVQVALDTTLVVHEFEAAYRATTEACKDSYPDWGQLVLRSEDGVHAKDVQKEHLIDPECPQGEWIEFHNF